MEEFSPEWKLQHLLNHKELLHTLLKNNYQDPVKLQEILDSICKNNILIVQAKLEIDKKDSIGLHEWLSQKL